MKKVAPVLAVVAILASLSAFAYETNTPTSYSGPGGGGVSGETDLSGTSAVAAKQQIRANAEEIAEFNRVYSPEILDVIRNARSVLISKMGAASVAQMSDFEVLQALSK